MSNKHSQISQSEKKNMQNQKNKFGTKISINAQNTGISPNFLVWKFYVKAQFLPGFKRFCRNCAFP